MVDFGVEDGVDDASDDESDDVAEGEAVVLLGVDDVELEEEVVVDEL